MYCCTRTKTSKVQGTILQRLVATKVTAAFKVFLIALVLKRPTAVYGLSLQRPKVNVVQLLDPKMIKSTTHTATSAAAAATARRINNNVLVIIPESKWRPEAHRHTQRIQTLLQPGLTSMDDQINSGIRRSLRQQKRKLGQNQHQWTALDGKNPIFNFLIEYYGLKGAKGPRRLGRWSPDPKLLLNSIKSADADTPTVATGDGIQIQCLNEIDCYNDSASTSTDEDGTVTEEILSSIIEISKGQGGIFLHNANEEDLGDILHLRGAIPITSPIPSTPSTELINNNTVQDRIFHGILYNPSLFYNRYDPINQTTEGRKQLLKTIAPFQWYKSILETTLNSEPIFHCHGLHEWAMLYQPPNTPPPPSRKYQKHLPIRVTRETINAAVERRGISCTHVDALRFFAPDAGPLNHHGASLMRTDQLRLEQKGCVHAHMDLLKIALKLQPFLDANLLCDVLEVSIAARKLDVEASPYDVTSYGGGVVPVETEEGRRLYRSRQKELMERAEPVRKRLLHEYNTFMHLSFDDEFVGGEKSVIDSSKGSEQEGQDPNKMTDSSSNSYEYAAPERFARAQPGGLPWRKNLVDKTEAGL